MAEQLYGRQVIVEIGVAGELRRWRGLQVTGSVKKGRTSSANTAEVDITNLGPDSIAAAQSEEAIIRVFAGYETQRLLFTGTVNPGGATLEKQGPDRVLSISAKDGGYEYLRSRVNKSFDRGTSWQTVFDEMATATGLPIGNVNVPTGATNEGLVLVGSVRDVMRRLADTVDAEVSIQNQSWQVLPRGEPSADEAVVLSSTRLRNLIGSPSKERGGLKAKALLDGRISPGRRVVLESEEYSGDYRVVDVEHTFDSRMGQEFYSTATLEEVSV